MDESTVSANEVAKATFNLMLRIFVWKNALNESVEMNELPLREDFKAYEKKFLILFCVSHIKNCTLTDLEKNLLEKRSTVSTAVSKLCEKGLIIKSQPNKGDDGRKVYFRITKKGQETLNIYKEKFISHTSDFFEKLSAEGKKSFMQGIMNLNDVFIETEK